MLYGRALLGSGCRLELRALSAVSLSSAQFHFSAFPFPPLFIWLLSSSPISVTFCVSVSQYCLSPSLCFDFPLLALSERASWLPLEDNREDGLPRTQTPRFWESLLF